MDALVCLIWSGLAAWFVLAVALSALAGWHQDRPAGTRRTQ